MTNEITQHTNEELHSKKHALVERGSELSEISSDLSAQFHMLSSGSEIIIKLFHIADSVEEALRSIPWTAAATLFLTNIIKILFTLYQRKEDKPTIAMRVVTGLGAISIGIATCLLPTLLLPMLITSAAIETFQRGWDVCSMLASRLFGEWRHTIKETKQFKQEFDADYARLMQDKNNQIVFNEYRECKNKKIPINLHSNFYTDEQRHLVNLDLALTENKNELLRKKAEFANRIHDFALVAISLVGVGLLFTPAAPVGIAILVYTAVYGMLDKFNINPFKRLGEALFGNPFAAKKDHASIEKMNAKCRITAKETLTKTNESTAKIIDGIGASKQPSDDAAPKSTSTLDYPTTPSPHSNNSKLWVSAYPKCRPLPTPQCQPDLLHHQSMPQPQAGLTLLRV